jgi:hypothetical protein
VEVRAGGRAVLIMFDMQEGPQVIVKELHIVGNVAIPAADVHNS